MEEISVVTAPKPSPHSFDKHQGGLGTKQGPHPTALRLTVHLAVKQTIQQAGAEPRGQHTQVLRSRVESMPARLAQVLLSGTLLSSLNMQLLHSHVIKFASLEYNLMAFSSFIQLGNCPPKKLQNIFITPNGALYP